MAELTTNSKSAVVAVVIIFTGFMLGFHSETLIQGIFPDLIEHPADSYRQCKPELVNDYVGSYHNLK